jgi:MFS family permease
MSLSGGAASKEAPSKKQKNLVMDSSVQLLLIMSAKPIPVRSPAQPADAQYPPVRYAWYVVGVLTLVYVFSFIDRQILSLIVGPVRRDLHIGDAGVGILIGPVFAVFYTFFGIMLGRLADIRSRRSIVAGGFTLWSLFTAGCSLARNFTQMLFMRMGVGVGEAALSPAAYSLITDYFPPTRLATAISVYCMGIYIGSGMAFLLGGQVVRVASAHQEWTLPLIGSIRSWQMIFVVVGLPGLLLAPLMYTIREPIRRGFTSRSAQVPFKETFAYIFRNTQTFLCHNVGFGLLSLASYASAAWVPEFFRRTYHWDIPKVGLVYGSLVTVFGSAGIVGAGRIADWMRSRGALNANMRLGLYIAIAWIPFNVLLFLAPTAGWAVVWLVPGCIFAAAPFGIAPAAIQQMMPPPMRGQASAVYLFILNLIGLGIGPYAVAACTQYLFRRDDALRYSLAVVCATACALAGVTLAVGLKSYLGSLRHLETWKTGDRPLAP